MLAPTIIGRFFYFRMNGNLKFTEKLSKILYFRQFCYIILKFKIGGKIDELYR